jgi:hypothetical protein
MLLASIAGRASDDYPRHCNSPGRMTQSHIGCGHYGAQVSIQSVHEDEGEAYGECPASQHEGLENKQNMLL